MHLKVFSLLAVAVATVLAGVSASHKTAQVDVVPLAKLFDDGRDKNFKAPSPGSYTLPVIKPAGGGQLLDITGKTVELSALARDKISIVSFIYTGCSMEKGCPYSMSTLFDIFHTSEKVSGLAKNATLITISFDPEHDTPEAMAAYGTAAIADKSRDKKIPWHFLTAPSQRKLAPILKAYGQSINRQPASGTIDHLLRLYLVDRKGQVRNIYGLGFMDPRLLYADIYTLLMEDGTMSKPGS
jgi:protein SCO1/2